MIGTAALRRRLASTQQRLPISAIEGDVLLLRDGARCAVVESGGIAFDLRAPDEQAAIAGGWRRLLNALDFPVQMLVQAYPADVEAYGERLARGLYPGLRRMEGLDDLLGDHLEFVRYLVVQREMLERRFRIVVPWTPPAGSAGGLLGWLFPAFAARSSPSPAHAAAAERVLAQRCELILGHLAAIGLRARRLGGDDIATIWRDSIGGLRPRSARRRVLVSDASPAVSIPAAAAPAAAADAGRSFA